MKSKKSDITPWLMGVIGLLLIGGIFYGVYRWKSVQFEKRKDSTEGVEVLSNRLKEKMSELQDLRGRIRHLESGLQQSTSSFALQEKQLRTVTNISRELNGQLTEMQQLYDEDIIPTAYIAHSGVFFVDTNKEKRMIISSQFVNIMNDTLIDGIYTIEYTDAQLSPNEKYIAITGMDHGRKFVDIYDIKNDTYHRLVGAPSESPKWLSDNKLQIAGSGDADGIVLGVFESVDAQTPWELEKIANYSTAITTSTEE